MMRIVVISPSLAERIALEDILSAEGHHVTSVATRTEGVSLATEGHADVIVADVQVHLDGIALVKELARCRPAARLIVLCPRVSRVIEKGGVICLPKPVDLDALLDYVAQPAAAPDQGWPEVQASTS
jgi:DNA-binding response OmpR family regulator